MTTEPLRGYWDDGFPEVPVAATGPQDLAELAVRLGSIVRYDRDGQVVYLEDFRDGVAKWRTSLTGAGAAAVLSAATSRSGAYSFALTAGSSDSTEVSVTNSIQPLQTSPLGVEASVAVTAADAAGTPVTCTLTLHLFIQDGVTVRRGALRWVLPAGTVQYLDANLAYQTIGSALSVFHSLNHFHTLKFVMDLSTATYRRAKIDNVEFDVADITIPTPAGADKPDVHVSLVITGPGGTNPVSYWDDVIVTQAEPTGA